MAKVLIVYDSKYGNTKTVAETIAQGLKEVKGIETTLKSVKEVRPEAVPGFDAILVGSPNHIGRATSDIRKFIDNLGKMNLPGKAIAVFDTYMKEEIGKAVKGMEKQVGEKALGMRLLTPGLSIRVEGMKGPLTEGELPKCKEFGKRVGEKLVGA
jgi:flavodoxin